MSEIGELMEDVGQVSVPDAAEERSLLARSRAGDREARDELVRRNVPLVVSMAKRMPRHYREGHFQDLISAGIAGLIRGIDEFDPSYGARLSTSASYWIRQQMGEAIRSELHLIRIPTYLRTAMANIRKGKKLTRPVRQEYLGLAIRAISFRSPGLHGAVPADDPISGLVSPDDPEGMHGVLLEELAVLLPSAMNTLAPREALIVRARFGLGGGSPRDRADIGREIGVSRERVRQIELIALDKLRRVLDVSTKGVA